jgi:hypothetical protein
VTTDSSAPIRVGATLTGERGRRIGTVDAVFVDYLLVRTSGVLPIDLYVPRPEVTIGADRLWVACGPDEAYRRWHRPLKRAPHADREQG